MARVIPSGNATAPLKKALAIRVRGGCDVTLKLFIVLRLRRGIPASKSRAGSQRTARPHSIDSRLSRGRDRAIARGRDATDSPRICIDYSRRRRKRDHGSRGTDSQHYDNAALSRESGNATPARVEKCDVRVTRVYNPYR